MRIYKFYTTSRWGCRSITTLIVCVATSATLGACSSSGSTPKRAADNSSTCTEIRRTYPSIARSHLSIGYSAAKNYDAPDVNDPSKVVGIEPTLMSKLSSCLGFSYSYTAIDFNGLISALQSGRIDLISSGMYASDERAQKVNFVEYMKAGEASVVRAGNPRHLTSLQASCGATAAEQIGTVENAIFAKQSKACVAAKRPPISALSFSTVDQALNAVAQGRADVFLTDAGLAAYQAKTSGGKLAVGFAIKSDFVFGLGVRKGNDSLLKALHETLGYLHDNGQLLQAMKKWGFRSDQLFTPTIKT